VFYGDEISGRRLTISTNFSASQLTITSYLNLDTTNVASFLNASCTGTVSAGLPTHLILTVNHPYAASANGTATTNGDYMDETVDKPVMLLTELTIVDGLGDTTGLFDKWASERTEDTVVQGLDDKYCSMGGGEEGCLANYSGAAGDFTRTKEAASWLEQYTREAQLNAAIGNSLVQLHHSIGVVYGDQRIQGYQPGLHLPSEYLLSENFDRADIDGGFSLPSKTSDAATPTCHHSVDCGRLRCAGGCNGRSALRSAGHFFGGKAFRLGQQPSLIGGPFRGRSAQFHAVQRLQLLPSRQPYGG
jgi:hypothetical protein